MTDAAPAGRATIIADARTPGQADSGSVTFWQRNPILKSPGTRFDPVLSILSKALLIFLAEYAAAPTRTISRRNALAARAAALRAARSRHVAHNLVPVWRL